MSACQPECATRKTTMPNDAAAPIANDMTTSVMPGAEAGRSPLQVIVAAMARVYAHSGGLPRGPRKSQENPQKIESNVARRAQRLFGLQHDLRATQRGKARHEHGSGTCSEAAPINARPPRARRSPPDDSLPAPPQCDWSRLARPCRRRPASGGWRRCLRPRGRSRSTGRGAATA